MQEPSMSTVTTTKNARIERLERSVSPKIRKNRKLLAQYGLVSEGSEAGDLVRGDGRRGRDVQRREASAHRDCGEHVAPFAHQRRQARSFCAEHEHEGFGGQRETVHERVTATVQPDDPDAGGLE